MALVHHELCFGCGRTNLFGLLLEMDEGEPGVVSGRCFVKQDHQGPERGRIHEGVLGAALVEAMALACGLDARVVSYEVSVESPVAVGSFVEVQARIGERDGPLANATASASAEQRMVARARGRFRV